MRTLIYLTACLCGLVASQPQRRIAKPIPLGFNPRPFSPQYAAKSYTPQFVSPKPTVSSPSQYNAQEYDPSLNSVGFSTAAPSPSPQAFSATPRIAQYQDGSTSEYVTPIPIIRFDKEQSIDGSYKSSYETGNNIFAEETGFLKNVGVKDQEALVQHGSYSYTSPDGQVITVHYTADEGGFRAEGAHIPTPPPVPAEIQKSLDLIYENIRLQQEAARTDPKLYKALQQQEDGLYQENSYANNFR